jgi:recombination associated protein RdgC
MWFKNLLVYRLDAKHGLTADALEENLSRDALQPCGSLQMESRGWVPPRGNERYVHALERQWLIAFGVNQRLLPASVINQETKERAAVQADKQGHPAGRKQIREIRERVITELMPKALTRRRVLRAWIDPVNRWLVVDTAAEKKAEELLDSLRKAAGGITTKRLDTAQSPSAVMTKWLAAGKAPAPFSIDQDLELRAASEGRATVRYVNHPLDGREIRDHISAGKAATRLGITWKERVSFALTELGQVKRVTFLDVLKEETQTKAEDAEEQFDIDFALMTGEFTFLLADLTKTLGGEKVRED